MAAIEAVLFDKDGTLIDFQGTWGPTFHVLMSELSGGDMAIAERLAEAAGFDLPARRFAPDSVLVAGSNDDIVDAFAEILGLPDPRALADDINARIGDMSLPYLSPFDDLIPMLDRLAVHGLVLGVATNDSEASARAQLAAMGISDRFSAIIGFDSGHLVPVAWLDQITDSQPGGDRFEIVQEMRRTATNHGVGEPIKKGMTVYTYDGRAAVVLRPRPLKIRMTDSGEVFHCRRSQIDWPLTRLANPATKRRSRPRAQPLANAISGAQ